MAVCPYLLNNCDTWCGVTDSAIEELDKLQNLFYRVILQVPVGCPIPMGLRWIFDVEQNFAVQDKSAPPHCHAQPQLTSLPGIQHTGQAVSAWFSAGMPANVDQF